MIQIKQAVIVEGKYDKIKVSNILDTLIIETDGFGIFKDKNKQKLIRRLKKRKIRHANTIKIQIILFLNFLFFMLSPLF